MLEELWNNSSMKDEQTRHKITLSLPRETWEAMNELARTHQRSFTKELVWALQEYIRRERREQQRKGEE
jgi:hypothetical protein